MSHYQDGVQDMESRMTRKNGWNEIIDAYMGKLPANWPYTSMVTDPRIRTVVLEKTGRLLNSKLQGRLVPREGGDVIKARINNAVLDFQWDYADHGGSMNEKIANVDQTARLLGAGFALIYWDAKRNTNELKPIDGRDVFFEGGATHIKNSKWVQIREFTTADVLEARGYDVSKLKKAAKEGQGEDRRDTSYESRVKSNRGLEDRIGDDDAFTIFEVVTEYTPTTRCLFLPRHAEMIDSGPNPYKHGRIPVAQLRYYPLGDDIYGESEVEPVLPLQRAINAILCGFIDEMNLSMRPPLKIEKGGVRMETIEYGPGAKWIMNTLNSVQELQMGTGAISNFNNTYPALVAAFNTAMGDQSLGVSNIKGYATDKTATEVASLERQQNSRDQYNQLYLGEFLKDVMLMWLSNNKQYLFDDPTKKFQVVKIIGKDNIRDLQAFGLDEKELADDTVQEIAQAIEGGAAMSDEALTTLVEDVTVPKYPVIENPNDDPMNYKVRSKLEIKNNQEAELFLTPDDMDGVYDYVPDVKSMAAGAGVMAQKARQEAVELALNPQVQQMLTAKGESFDIKELLVANLEDAGYKDADSLFTQNDNGSQTNQTGNQPTGQGAPQGGQALPGAQGVPAIQGGPQAIPFGPSL
ncbi:MAG: hypothetical protein KDH96_09490 [Candidatus Riesia sp.]|nr:hypothetical protein [Candidatus Riesia sp.]